MPAAAVSETPTSIPLSPEAGTVRETVPHSSLASHVIGEKALTDRVARSRAKLLTLQILPRFNQPLSTPISDRSLSSGKMFKR